MHKLHGLIRPLVFQQTDCPVVDGIPKNKKWQSFYKAFKDLTSSRNTSLLHSTESHPAESGSVKTRQHIYEIDAAGSDNSKSEDLVSNGTSADPKAMNPSEQRRNNDESDYDVLIVDWDFMSAVPEYSEEDVAEKLLWDDYTRLHSPPAETITRDELFEPGKEEALWTEDATDATDIDINDVVVYESGEKVERSVDKDTIDAKEVLDVFDSNRRMNGSKEGANWRRDNALSWEGVTEIIQWDDLIKQGKEDSLTPGNVTEVELDAVVISCGRTSHSRVEGGNGFSDEKKVKDVLDDNIAMKGTGAKGKWGFMFRFARVMGSFIKYDV